MENKYLFAEKKVHVTFSHEYILDRCKGYETDGECDYDITVTEEDIAYERDNATDGVYGDGYLEYLAFYRLFCTRAAMDHILLFHSFACEVDGEAYLFTAKSGTGKTTHGRLWKELLGDRMHVVNGDKPLIKVEKGQMTVYGTPWNGKECFGENTSAKVKAICFIERGVDNEMNQISDKEVFPKLYSQTFKPNDETALVNVVSDVMKMSKSVPVYRLKCNISMDAAMLSFGTMKEEKL